MISGLLVTLILIGVGLLIAVFLGLAVRSAVKKDLEKTDEPPSEAAKKEWENAPGDSNEDIS